MEPFSIGGQTVARGRRATIQMEIPALYTHTPVQMPVHVICGKREGPVVFITSAVHGNELNGIEIIRRLRRPGALRSLKGTLLLVPVVNVYGLINRSRYTPDRRDVNRSFPGSAKGSIASRLAQIIATQIIARADLGIDLHTGAIHRSNLPQIRTNIKHPESLKLARAFGAPVVLHSELRDGSLRSHADEQGVPVLLYEAGEGLRIDERSVRTGVTGIVNVLRALGMLPPRENGPAEPVICESSHWIRAGHSGILRMARGLGDRIEKETLIATIDDPLGDDSFPIYANRPGIVIGRSELPLVQEGDAIFNIAEYDNLEEAEGKLERIIDGDDDPMLEELVDEMPLV